MAVYELTHNGRTGVNKGIILMSDGQPNASTVSTSNYCLQSNTAATAAKAPGIEIFTVGFGLDGSNDIACPDTSGAWKGKMASALLASHGHLVRRRGRLPHHREHRQRPLLLRSEDGRRVGRSLERLQDGGNVARSGNQARRAAVRLLVGPTHGGGAHKCASGPGRATGPSVRSRPRPARAARPAPPPAAPAPGAPRRSRACHDAGACARRTSATRASSHIPRVRLSHIPDGRCPRGARSVRPIHIGGARSPNEPPMCAVGTFSTRRTRSDRSCRQECALAARRPGRRGHRRGPWTTATRPCTIEHAFGGQPPGWRWKSRVTPVDDRPASVDEGRPSVDRAGTEPPTRCHNMLRCDRTSDHYILWFWA